MLCMRLGKTVYGQHYPSSCTSTFIAWSSMLSLSFAAVVPLRVPRPGSERRFRSGLCHRLCGSESVTLTTRCVGARARSGVVHCWTSASVVVEPVACHHGSEAHFVCAYSTGNTGTSAPLASHPGLPPPWLPNYVVLHRGSPNHQATWPPGDILRERYIWSCITRRKGIPKETRSDLGTDAGQTKCLRVVIRIHVPPSLCLSTQKVYRL